MVGDVNQSTVSTKSIAYRPWRGSINTTTIKCEVISMRLEYLVSTMNRESIEFINAMNLKGFGCIINQCQKNDSLTYRDSKIRLLSYQEKGLSRSRNRALENANGDICILADDDIRYVDNANEIIEKAYKKHIDADIIVFQVKNSNGKLYKKYKDKAYQINTLTSLKVSSVEISFKLSRIRDKGILFDENFGAGAQFSCGEENIFLIDSLKRDLKIFYEPEVIAVLEESDSAWFNGFNEKYFRDKGAIFSRMSERFSNILIIQFCIRKYMHYYKDISFYKAIQEMFKGKKIYRGFKE